MKSLVQYLYVNQALLDDYTSQLEIGGPQKELSKITSKTSVSIAGPKLESNREYQYLDAPQHAKIQALESELEKLQLVICTRPVDVRDLSSYGSLVFVKETVVATKLVFPAKALEDLPGVGQFAIWVADPVPAPTAEEPYDFRTSFLLLSQIVFDGEGLATTHSGCSALQAIMNGYDGRSLLESEWGESLGRGSYEHPIEKLKSRGGVASLPQRISVLYRIRYISDEQCYTLSGRKRRVHDLLGYPLYIAAT